MSAGWGWGQLGSSVFPLLLPEQCHSSVSPAHPRQPVPSPFPHSLRGPMDLPLLSAPPGGQQVPKGLGGSAGVGADSSFL